MSGSLTLVGYAGDAEAVLASLRASSGAVTGAERVAIFTAASSAMGEKAPDVLVVVRSDAPATEATLEAIIAALGVPAPTFRATFRYMRTFGEAGGRAARALLVGMTDVAAPDQRGAFDHWYDTHHAVDVVRSGLYFVAERHQRAAGDAPEFLAVYGTEGDEPDTFARYFAWEARDRTRSAAALVRNVWTFRLAFATPEVMTWN